MLKHTQRDSKILKLFDPPFCGVGTEIVKKLFGEVNGYPTWWHYLFYITKKGISVWDFSHLKVYVDQSED